MPDIVRDGPVELVQLLTPEGERVHHPDYELDLADEEYRALYRDLVLTRRVDLEATALQRQGELGLWAGLLGPRGRPGRIRPSDGRPMTSRFRPTASTESPSPAAWTRCPCSGFSAA